MNCPACFNVLQEVTVGDIKVDICEGGCGGIWFDQFEFKKFDEPHESTGEGLLDVKRDESVSVDHTKRRRCPRCGDIVMMRHFFSVKKEVEIDECPGCAGIWLDADELNKIRSLFASEQEKNKAADEYFSQLFGDEIAVSEVQDQAKVAGARRLANMFRFVCPSYYMPGEQNWGAF